MNPFKSASDALTRVGKGCVALFRRARRPLTFAACRLFIRLHINQTHVTVFRMLMMAGFYFAWVAHNIWLAFALMFGSVLLDCVDGDLSRMLGNANAVGEFEDYFADNLVFPLFPLALMQTGLLQIVPGSIVIFSASCVLWMAVRRQSTSGDNLQFHPKGDLLLSLARKAVWILMYLYIFFRLDFFNPGYAVLAAMLGADTAVNYFQVIRSRLKP